MLDIPKVRQETKHIADHIFVNSAGASLMPDCVVEAVKDYMDLEAKFGGYKVMNMMDQDINEFYTEIGKLVNCKPSNIAFAFNASDAYAKAMSSIVFSPGDKVLITSVDYVSNYMFFINLKWRSGIEILIVDDLPNGDLDLLDLESKIVAHHPRVVAITHMPTNSGLIQDVVAIGQICRKYPNVIYMLDACQSLGQMKVDVKEIQCDFMAVTGRKFLRGTRGTGFLYVSDRMIEKDVSPSSTDAFGSDWISPLDYRPKANATRYELFEKPFPLLAGLKEAIRYINHLGIDNIESRCNEVSNKLRSNLNEINDVVMLDKGTNLGSIITFVKSGKSKADSIAHLESNNIIFSTAERFSALVDFDNKGKDWAIRLSPHYFNTFEEIDELSTIIESL